MAERIGNVTAATFNGLRCNVVLASVVDHADGDRSYLFPNDAPLGSTRYYQIEYLDSDELYEAGETEDAVPGHAIAFGESQTKPKTERIRDGIKALLN